MRDPTIAKARELGAKLRTIDQGRDAINLAGRTLRAAVGMLTSFAWPDVAMGVSKAYASRLEQQITRLGTLRTRITSQPWTRAQADSVGLALVQSAGVLADIRRDVRLSQTETSIGRLAEDFARALKQILEGLALAVPWWGWAIGLYLLTQPSKTTIYYRGARVTRTTGHRARKRREIA